MRQKCGCKKKRKDPISCSTHHSWTRPEEQQLREWARHALRLGSENSIQIIPRPKQRACATWLCWEIVPVKAVNRIDVKGQDPPGVSLTHFCSDHYDYTDCNWPATPYSCSNPHMETPWDTTACPLQVYQTTCRVFGQTPTQPQGCFFFLG